MAKPTVSKPQRRRSPLLFVPADEIDFVFGYANPNPERIGCPSYEVLVALSRRERPIGDHAYGHLGECSDCYREMRSLRLEAMRMSGIDQRRWLRRWRIAGRYPH